MKHPYSVDLYAARVVAKARFVLVRLLGGMDYWRYGVEELSRTARAHGVALAIVPGDHREDARLDAASTLPVDDLRRLWAFFQHGGTGNMGSLHGWIATRLGHAAIWSEPKPVPPAGRYVAACRKVEASTGRAFITFYRSMVLAGDCAPIVALADALAARGLAVTALYATSLKDPAAAKILREMIDAEKPDVIVNTTAFSGRGDATPSVLDAADAPGAAGDPRRRERGAMARQPARPWPGRPRDERRAAGNGRPARHSGDLLQGGKPHAARRWNSPGWSTGRSPHASPSSPIWRRPWVRLRRTPAADRRLAMVLSDYPGKRGREAYAVGLDTPASVAGDRPRICGPRATRSRICRTI